MREMPILPGGGLRIFFREVYRPKDPKNPVDPIYNNKTKIESMLFN
jgi:hypothetical protein